MAWTEIGDLNASKLLYTVEDLDENVKYKFRIRAQNKVGLSEPVELSEYFTARDPWGKCLGFIKSFFVPVSKVECYYLTKILKRKLFRFNESSRTIQVVL